MPLNQRLLRLAVTKEPQVKRVLIAKVRPIIKLDFEAKKEQFLHAFDEDDVSQEISEGPEAFSRHSALAKTGGNLFSLLGFWSHQDPVASLREYLNDNVVLYRTQAGKVKGNRVVFDTEVIAPTEAEIHAVMASDPGSSLDWSPDRSWTALLAGGISGMPQYLFDLTRDFSHIPSRSGPAIQTKGDLRKGAANLHKIPYVQRLLGVLGRVISPKK